MPSSLAFTTSEQKEYEINGYKLIPSRFACSEQYNVYKEKQNVGYLRLRCGIFTCYYKEKSIYDVPTKGEILFEEKERMIFLKEAIRLLDGIIKNENRK